MHVDLNEVQFSFVRASGPGGQNVNKVATAVLLRFNIPNSLSIPEHLKPRILAALAVRLTQQGDLMVKAQRFRTQELNKQDAIERLLAILHKASFIPKKRKKTKPTQSSIEKRIDHKKKRSKQKSLRRNIDM